MNSYVYIHPDAEQAATSSGHLERLQRLRETIESTSNTSRFSRWLHPYYHEDIGRKYRLLVELHEREEARVIVFRYFLSHEEYDRLCAYEQQALRQHYSDHLTDDETISNHIERRKDSETPQPSRLTPSDRIFLNTRPIQYNLLESHIILETHEWCETMEKWCETMERPLVKHMAHSLHKVIESILERIESESAVASSNVEVIDGEDLKVMYRYFDQWSILLLIDVIRKGHVQNDEQVLRDRYGIQFSETDELKQRCQRLYPWLLVADFDIWFDVQSTQKANLILSPEELKVLESLRTLDADSPRYPLFINGRAGSGKSTVLQYLFAGVLDTYCEIEDVGEPPIYITYTKQLLKVARDTVDEVRELSARQLEKRPTNGTRLSRGTSPARFDACFKTVRDLMRELLPSPALKQNYKLSKCMTLSEFRTRWDKHRKQLPDKGARELRAGIVWHGIRTYIKGLGIGSTREYGRLPKDWKSITEDTFSIVFESGWRWYEGICQEEGLWDDQDLANELLQCNDDELSRFPAIYCDEAQDFTAIELKLIQRLSRFSAYDFTNESHLLRNIPFAFSGDPFQTLNPTGFNWGNIKAMYHNYLIQRSGSMGTTGIGLNYHELSINYRSAAGIIKLSNLVQLIRSLLTDDTEAKPQDARDPTQESVPQIYVLGERDKQVEKRIRESDELVIIVPCDEDGEDDYLDGDAFLKSLVQQDDGNRARIMSPLRAKGLEWERVLVYRFGDFALDQCKALCSFLRDPAKGSLHGMAEGELLFSEYFFNKLYVAVTRPRKRLFLADTKRAVDSFWRFANDVTVTETLSALRGWQSSHLGGIVIGDDDSWDKDKDSPIDIAEKLEKQGMSDGDSRLFLSAKYYYRIGGDRDGQDRCEAQIAELKHDFAVADRIYAKLNDWPSVLKCRWVRGDWSRMISAVDGGVHIEPSSETATLVGAAKLLHVREVRHSDVVEVLDALTGQHRVSFVGDQWLSTGLDRFFVNLMDLLESLDFGSDESWHAIPSAIENALGSLGVSGKELELKLAHVFYRLGDPESAIRIWKKYSDGRQPTQRQDPSWVIRAFALSVGEIQRLRLLSQHDDHEGVLEAWSEVVASGASISTDLVQLVTQSAAGKGDWGSIFESLERLESTDRWIRLVIQVGGFMDSDAKSEAGPKVLVALVRRLVAARDWSQIAELCDEHPRTEGVLFEIRQEWRWKRIELLAFATDVLARAVDLRSGGPEDRKAVRQSFVKRHLWQRETRKGKARSGPPDLRIVVRWFGEVRILASLVELVCSRQEASEFYSMLLSALDGMGASDDQLRFGRERFAFCVARLPRRRANLDKFLERWSISVSELPETVVLPRDSSDYYLALASRVRGVGKRVKGADTPPSPKAPERQRQTRTGSGPAEDVSTEVVIRFEDRILRGDVRQMKRRIVLRDDDDNEVRCGPDHVVSDDMAVDPIGDGADLRWEVPGWGIECRILRRSGARTIQFYSASGAILPGFVFPAMTEGGEEG